MLKSFALMTIFFTNTILAMEVCQYGKLKVLDNEFFNDLAMPNCTEVRPMQNLMCGCAEKLDKFFKDKKITKFDYNAPSSKRKKQDELFRMAETKLTALINDLNFANNTLNLDLSSKKEITESCNLKILNDQLSEPSCKGGNNIINKITNNNPSQLMNTLKEEGRILLSKDFSSSSEGFFNRASSKNSCHIPDSDIYNYQSFLEMSSALSTNRKDLLQSSPFGYHVVESGVVDEESFHQSTKNIKNLSEFQAFMNKAENLNNFKIGFIKNCKSTFKSVKETLCSDFRVETPNPKDFLEQAKVEIQYPEDIDSSPKLQDKYIQDQLKILSYCKGIEDENINSSSKVSNTYESLKNVLLYEKKDRNKILDNTKTVQMENGESYKDTYISKVREGMYSLTAASTNEDFKRLAYDKSYQYTRNILCKESNRPLKASELIARGCSINDFSKNFKKTSSSNAKERNCNLLVIDYVLNTPTEELETQNIDKNLLAYKKTIEENKKSNGGDLILDFLGVETPQEVASFKEAGIERSSASSSNDETNTKKNNVNTNATVQTKTPTTYQQVNPAFTGQGANSGNQITNGQTNYQSVEAYHSMTAQEQNQVSEIERELMRRLMGSKVNESSSAAKAEMYQKYSKEMMELAKEKARLEASGSSASNQDFASYEKKMQDLVNQMREDNKKIANAQKGNSNDNSGTTYINNFQGNSKGSNEGSSASFGGSGESISSGGVSNSNLNRALNETVNADKYAELTGKKPNQEVTGASRSIASDETGKGLALIENNKLVAITSLEEVFSQKIKEKKPFVIAQKDNPNFKVRITPDRDNKVTITPLGNLSDPSYKKFFEEIEESFKTDKELQKYHRKDLVESFSAIQR